MRIILLLACLAIGGTTSSRLKRASGGKEISIEDAPYMVSLRLHGRHVCGGALISMRHVLTTAHCVLDEELRPLDGLRVASGAGKYDRANYERNIHNVSAHENFKWGGPSYDIAVITSCGYSLNQGRRLNLNPTAGTSYQLFSNTLQLLLDVQQDETRRKIALPNAKIPREKYAKLIAFRSRWTRPSDAGLLELSVNIQNVTRPSNDIDNYDTVSYGTIKRPQSISNIDRGGPLVYDDTIVGLASLRPSNYQTCAYFVNVVKFKIFIEENTGIRNTSPSSQRPTVIKYAPKRRRF